MRVHAHAHVILYKIAILYRMEIMTYTREDLIWLAGFVDGEGCVSYVKRDKRPSFRFEIRISNTDLPVLEWIHQRFGGYLYRLRGSRFAKRHWKPCFQWWIADKRAKELYSELKPYLKIKGNVSPPPPLIKGRGSQP